MGNRQKTHESYRNNQVLETCYMCDKPKTSKEHVPPACFFPEQKDMLGADFRKNLIKVPSCEEHNLCNSKDDEYVLVVIATHWQNNQVGYSHTMTKVLRAIKRSKGLGYLFFGTGEHLLINIGSEQGVTVPLNKARFDSEMEKIARGIYFHQFKQKCRESVEIYSRSLVAILAEPNQTLTDLAQKNETRRLLCIFEPKHGANPDIFYYQFSQMTKTTQLPLSSGLVVPASRTATVMRLVFYGGFEVTAKFEEFALAVA